MTYRSIGRNYCIPDERYASASIIESLYTYIVVSTAGGSTYCTHSWCLQLLLSTPSYGQALA